ncbi:hypothetical protein GQS78_10380 [Thermococcus bergensis]|uniref:pentapeptide repeat-containing protein n=1 Tax=Thermococcus bergensis TaxID=2689387 RepID=UPI001CED5EEB|nr:pentapeptide repeat-containing protein [Thermococcus bergensis]MCA6214638.1 hypothetical protein [Thermococcus bergensis]
MCKMAHYGNCDPETADQEYCIFHKPNKSEEEAKEFYRKFLERFQPRVEEIEIGIKRFVFEKKVEARGFVFPEIPNEPLEYEDAYGNHWREIFSFEWAVFENGADFGYADFRNAAYLSFDVISFQNDFLSFEYAMFKGKANFENAIFTVARFTRAQFDHGRFTEAKFEYAEFIWAIFNIADFSKAIFKEEAVFEDSRARMGLFMGSKFEKGQFTRAQFEKAYFTDETLVYPGELFTIYEVWTDFKEADFTGAKFGELYFEKVRVLKSLNFDGVVITDRAALITKPPYDIRSLLDEECMNKQCWKNIDINNPLQACKKRFCHPQPLAETAKLQRIMYERLGDRENADKMFVLEMRAKRRLRKSKLSENAVQKAVSTWGVRQLLKFHDMVLSWLFNSSSPSEELLKLLVAIGPMAVVGLILTLFIMTFQFLYLAGYIGEVLIGDWVSLYGTSWERVLGASFLTIFGSAGGFWVCQKLGLGTVCLHSSVTPAGVVCEYTIHTFKDALYYSLVTFTTLGYGDMHPTGWLKALSALEAFTGAVFMALIVAVIARKWMR